MLTAAVEAQVPAPVAHDPAFVHAEAAKISLLPDGNYVFNFLPASDLVFEAWVAPDVHIVDNVASQLDKVLNGSRKRLWTYPAFGTFMVRLRMFDEDSNPVRTPSYMPKATVQFAAFRDISRGADTEQPDRRVAMWLIDIVPFGHHSNGQNGGLFTGYSRVDGECVTAVEVPVTVRTVNTENGSFSTNYIRTGVHYRRNLPGIGGRYSICRHTLAVGCRRTPRDQSHLVSIGGAISDDLHAIYGATRARVSASAARLQWRRFGRIEGKLALEYIPDAPSSVSNVTTVAEQLMLPRGWGGAGIFARFYRGQDYYNLAFLDDVSRLAVRPGFQPRQVPECSANT